MFIIAVENTDGQPSRSLRQVKRKELGNSMVINWIRESIECKVE